MFGLGKKHTLKVDIHSHVLPGIDDGARTMIDSLEMIRVFERLGFEKIITTPHIHPRYPNDPSIIESKLASLQNELTKRSLAMEVEAAAEYFVDESFLDLLKNNTPLLSFGDKYVLIESTFHNKPIYFEGAVYQLLDKGYTPIVAHPERYDFIDYTLDWVAELKEIGVMFQVTLASLSGMYGERPMKMAKRIIHAGFVDFMGSDMHRALQYTKLKQGLHNRLVQKMIQNRSLKNDRLL